MINHEVFYRFLEQCDLKAFEDAIVDIRKRQDPKFANQWAWAALEAIAGWCDTTQRYVPDTALFLVKLVDLFCHEWPVLIESGNPLLLRQVPSGLIRLLTFFVVVFWARILARACVGFSFFFTTVHRLQPFSI